MSDDGSSSEPNGDGARMRLEPDAIHEGDDAYALDCPECGSTVSLVRIIETGRCTGHLESEATEVEGDDEQLQDPNCTAELSLELVWES